MYSSKLIWGALAQFEKFGPKKLQKLKNRFKEPASLLSATRSALISAGLEAQIIDSFLVWKHQLDLDKFEKIITSSGINILLPESPEYPALLREISDPPQVLFCRGNLSALRSPLAVVGTRKITNYGKRVTEEIVTPLAKTGVSIVSGLALGIDAAAHWAAIKASGHTVAVLGSGIDDYSIYPATNKRLALEILASGGAIISEFAPGALSLKHHFPIRNRIIAGMTLGTLIIEADLDSGSLITARAALGENREVFAVPGDIFKDTSRGSNNLLKMGARVTSSAEDVAAVLEVEIDNPREALPIPDTPEEAAVILVLKTEPLHIDAIAKESRLDISTVSAMLTILEMKGAVKHLGGMNYVLSR